MAKMKSWAVDVEVVVKRTLFVEARKPGGAAEKALTEQGWNAALRYDDDHEFMQFRRRDAKVTGVREI